MPKLSESQIWRDLESNGQDSNCRSLKALFQDNPTRSEDFSATFEGIFLDYSRNHITEETRLLLLKLCDKAHLSDQTRAMFSGKKVNLTEGRPALHTALRSTGYGISHQYNADIQSLVKDNLERVSSFTNEFKNKELLGATGKPLDTVINIGIGGSDLGPRLVYTSLASTHDSEVHFVSNIDDDDLLSTLAKINPEKTLLVIASKTFTTDETITNANTAAKWMSEQLNTNIKTVIKYHFVATTANLDNARDFGVDAKHIFEFWDWVGGRFSLWSAIGLPISLGLGFDKFKLLLQGAKKMDDHFLTTPPIKNLPILLALTSIWNINFRNYPTHAVLTYSERLSLLTEYLQQLEMESNGKGIDRSGALTDYQTSSIIWGSKGSNYQHSFAQHLHQSPFVTPCDFIAVLPNTGKEKINSLALLANCFAQIETLTLGDSSAIGAKDEKERTEHMGVEGNRPNNVILLDQLDAEILGSLLAMYEHKVFTQGVIWNINSFDQWGVELGKKISKSIYTQFDQGHASASDGSSIDNLILRVKRALERE